MRRIIVLNSKGGCGKTTIATNLASYYASRDLSTALLDYDPQASSIRWLNARPDDYRAIHGVEAYQRARGDVTRTWQLRVPPGTERVIIDAPAGVSGQTLVEYVSQVDVILIPVLPSPIDIHAASRFIQDLLLVGKVRTRDIRLGVVANRVKENTLIFQALERFLTSLRFPFVARLRDTQYYTRAAERGVGIHDLEEPRVERDKEQWVGLLDWLEDDGLRESTAPVEEREAHADARSEASGDDVAEEPRMRSGPSLHVGK